ncbi:MAG: Gx transporter family protein [Oscillospiraceae bacterium]|nr:Gx transporter family protein [Oscillospiraceae bacterium]
MNKSNVKKLTTIAILTAVAICLAIFEQMLPPITAIPGGKLGLANIVTMIALYKFGGGTAIGIAVTRSILGSLLYGGASALPYSLAGALLSSILMVLFYRRAGLSFIGIGVIGGVSHNIAQTIVAAAILQNIYVLTYMPVLMIVAVFAGAFTGFAAIQVTKRLKNP